MPQMQIPLMRGDSVNPDGDYFDFLPKNFIAIPKEVRGSTGYMLACDGLKRMFAAVGEDRGGFYNDRMNEHFRVSGDKLIIVNSLSSYSLIGQIDGGGQCSMPYSFQSQLVVSGGNVYRYAASVLTRLADVDFGRPLDADWIDGYYFFTDGEYLYHTLLSDETQVAPTDYAVAEIMPDKSLGLMRTPDNLMMVFGRFSIEYFYNDGSTNFAFSRIAQKSMKIGICGTYCKVELDGDIYILGGRRYESPSFYAIQSGNAASVSSRSVDKIIAEYTETELASVVIEGRVRNRMSYLIARLPRHTLMLNVTLAKQLGAANAWTILSTGVDSDRWIGVNGVFDPNLSQWVYGCNEDGRVFYLDPDSTAQDGEYTECELQTPFIPLDKKRIAQLEINTVPGFVAQDTTIFFAVSPDGYVLSTDWIQMYSTPLNYDMRFFVRRIGYFQQKAVLRFRSLTKDKINLSNLVITYG
jgi:hypothetical protein